MIVSDMEERIQIQYLYLYLQAHVTYPRLLVMVMPAAWEV